MSEGEAAHRGSGQWITPALLRSMPLPAYGPEADKARRGKLLVIAGSRRLPGAPLLVARAALRTGCGTVRVAAPASIATALGVALPELMVLPLPETPAGAPAGDASTVLAEQYPEVQAAVVGPGLDEDAGAYDLVRGVVAGCPTPLVVDAAALGACAGGGAAPGTPAPAAGGTPPAGRVLTPHAGEMERLTGGPVPPEAPAGGDDSERARMARDFARTRGVTLVLKARETLVSDPGGALYRNTAGTRGLGTAGSGDALAGVIGSLLAQGLGATPAAVWGVHLHALAGEAAAEAAGPDGLLASDAVERLPAVLRALRRLTAG